MQKKCKIKFMYSESKKQGNEFLAKIVLHNIGLKENKFKSN